MENIIEKIHHEFKTSYLETFRDVTDKVEKSTFVKKEECEKAAQLGFSNSVSLKKYFNDKKVYEDSKEMLDNIKRFKIDYPTKKFITFKDAADIIRKYGLIIAEPSKFIGEFPEKNLKEMTSFKLKEQDEAYIINDLTKLYETNQTEYLRQHPREALQYLRRLGGSREIPPMPQTEVFKYYINHDNSIVNKLDFGPLKGDEDSWEDKLNTNKVLIIGTKDQFQLNQNEVMVGGSIVELKDDPIVVKPVKNGFLILTVWGDEAQLPEIKDNTLN